MIQNTLVTVATSNYKNYLYTFLKSAKANLKKDYKIIVVHDHIDEEIISKSKEIAGSHFSLVFYSIYVYQDIDNLEYLIKNPVYWRLIVPYIPEVSKLKRLLYIDLDTLILTDLTDLFNYDLKGMTIGACIDYLKEIKIGISNWNELGLNPTGLYFNAGVLLIDTERYKSKEISKKVMKIVRENDKYLLACGKWAQNDQYGLNVALVNDWLMLPIEYNYGSELEYKKCNILHFIGNGKPSSRTCKSEFSEEFSKYLEESLKNKNEKK